MKITLLLGGVVVVCLSCCAFPVFAADGFGANATGGAGGPVVTVSTAADFGTYVQSPDTYIVQVSGIIDLVTIGGTVSIQSNKTIRGIGTSPTIMGNLRFVYDSNNIIIERLTITNPPPGYGEGDGISVKDRITNLFITHCTFYNCADGCIDITNESDYVTVSWCKFYYFSQISHCFVNLIGADDADYADRGKLHVTFHHNWWADGCYSRMPRVRFGRVHVYNNYYSCTDNDYCAAAAKESQLLIENNYYNNVDCPYAYWLFSPYGKLKAVGNIFYNFTWSNFDMGGIFTPPYSYTLDTGADVKSIVMAGAGAPVCYGDFTGIGTVNMEDLKQFVEEYWLVNDPEQIADADYYDDGIVNFREFALLAKNWKKTDFTAPLPPTNLAATAGDGTVSLDWSDNGEGDLASYNIYRSTTFGGGYAKVNGSPLSSSDYIDNTVTNSTIYYYVVTAVDTALNESAYSNQVSAIPLDAGSIIIQEYDIGFCSVEGTIGKQYAGYTSYGFCVTSVSNPNGKGIDWKISVPSSGTYIFVWRYALATGDDRTAKLIVNDVTVVPSISFPATGAMDKLERSIS